jgi:hypothetical protein
MNALSPGACSPGMSSGRGRDIPTRPPRTTASPYGRDASLPCPLKPPLAQVGPRSFPCPPEKGTRMAAWQSPQLSRNKPLRKNFSGGPYQP